MSVTDKMGSQFISSEAIKNSSQVGKNVLSYCSKCKMNLSHTVVTVTAANKPNRVLCNTCKAEKQYRAPKSELELSQERRQKMELDDELDLDLDAGAKKLNATEDGPRKKSKAKSKAKKSKDDSDSSRSSSKNAGQLPLSMQEGTPEDKAQYEARLSAAKNNLAGAKDYSPYVRFTTGEIINHKTFGFGFVVSESGSNKVEVLFSLGRKLLAVGLPQR